MFCMSNHTTLTTTDGTSNTVTNCRKWARLLHNTTSWILTIWNISRPTLHTGRGAAVFDVVNTTHIRTRSVPHINSNNNINRA